MRISSILASSGTVVAVVILLASRPAPALTFLELVTGDEAVSPDARSVAMGRTRVGQTGAFAVAQNPAWLSRAEHPLLMFGGASQRLEESRATPAFDSFDGFLVESTYALNDEYRSSGGIGATYALSLQQIPGKIGLGGSWEPVRDYRYSYTEEVRDNNAFTQPRDGLIALNDVQSDGTLSGLTFGLALSPVDWIAGGASVQFLRGKQDLLHRTQFFDPDSMSASTLNVSSISGERFILGLTAHPSHHFDFAASWKSQTDLDGAYELAGSSGDFDYVGDTGPIGPTGGVKLRYPHVVAMGVTYHPRAKMRTTIRAEATFTDWSTFRNSLYDDVRLSDVWDGRIGLEHVFYNGFAARFGLVYVPSPQNTEIVTSGFTFGGGFVRGPVHADLGFEVGSRQYRFEDLFPDSDFGGTDRTQKDLVEESSFGAFLTLSLELDTLRE